MTIGIVCYPTFGGSGVVATELGTYLARKGHKVHFITYNQPVRLDILEENIYYHEVNVHDYPLFQYQPYELALSSKMVDTVLNEGIELLHVHYAIPHAYAAYMAKQILADKGLHIPVVTTLHGTDITLVGRNPSYKPAVTFSINHSDIVTSVSEDLKRETVKFFVVRKDIEVIPNFIDLSLYEGEKNCSPAGLLHPGQKMITHVSNFRKVKRIMDIVEAFALVRQEVNSRLIMIGDGPERERAEELAKERGVAEDVVFLGKTNEVERILCMSDLFLLPSETESFGLAALEAMAAKVPVISSNAGGLPEVNINGKTGYTVNVGDVKKMAKMSVKLLSDEKLHAEFKKNAFARAQEFSMDRILPLYEGAYERALEGIKNPI
ncbi:N-acetyl-alpha-D-glucosaminyl L-malate synthase BshA [Phaeocystidibacter luteus]|uniref:N-acetyl-alpha-D-glucosaminyl L-malate synthase BshA n=1 Tax=Phaeocystidibacter luteus TaxID=911197 RepID=A0A6N6RDU6_9FLAO|nr:N-acetyl-alpha-D-glucosaminyl L-malate synthase BshA [Phaeocystidibacter luteus]KAB2807314.1 N-acetyl-alpha-D-glucosaminyl L-malate synthase BshA [Phaeocystidibacter luteus]